MNESYFWKILLSQFVAEGFLTVDESSKVIKQLLKEADYERVG